MKIKTSILFLSFFSIIASSQAQVPKDLFIQRFQNSFPSVICHKDSMFRACFPNVTSQQCNDFVYNETGTCIKELKTPIPAIVNSESGSRIGSNIGRCVGARYQIKFQINPQKENACILQKIRKVIPGLPRKQ